MSPTPAKDQPGQAQHDAAIRRRGRPRLATFSGDPTQVNIRFSHERTHINICLAASSTDEACSTDISTKERKFNS